MVGEPPSMDQGERIFLVSQYSLINLSGVSKKDNAYNIANCFIQGHASRRDFSVLGPGEKIITREKKKGD
jgi:hypothetical protein